MSLLESSIGLFDPKSEGWSTYTERVEQHLTANGVVEAEKRHAFLLSVSGATVYQLVRSLVALAKPKDKSFEESVKLVQEHLTLYRLSIVQRFHFHVCTQKETESVAEFVASLCHLAEACEFGGTLEETLRDRLVCALRDHRVQRWLLTEQDYN